MYHVDGEVNHKEKTMADICLEKNDLLLLLLQMPMFNSYDAAIKSIHPVRLTHVREGALNKNTQEAA